MASQKKALSTVSNPALTNWDTGTRARSTNLYRLAIVTFGGGNFGQLTDALGLKYREFNFPVNPQSLDQDETIAVNITPSQDGGSFIEHQGSLFKNIVITGTTGFRPDNRSKSGAYPTIIGAALNAIRSPTVDPTTGLPIGEKSGFQLITELRNFFRTYFDIKRDPENAFRHVMVWQNVHEAEFYVVEPTNFKSRRDSSSPVTATYEIQLRTIQPVDHAFAAIQGDDRDTRNALERMNQFLGECARTISWSLGTLNAYGDILHQGAMSFVTSLLAPSTALYNGIIQLTSTADNILSIPRITVKDLCADAIKAYELLQQKWREWSTIAPEPNSIALTWSAAASASKNIARAAARIYEKDQLFLPSTSTTMTRPLDAYNNPARGNTPPQTGGSPTFLGNTSIPSGTGVAVVGNQDTIYSIAQRVLGDQARYKELVLVNQLKAPYVSPNGDGMNVLRPGDSILYPTRTGKNVISIVPDLTQERSVLTNRLGRDILLVDTQAAGGYAVFDLAVGSDGDLARVEGVPNLEQAIQLKFSTEQGTLPTHPNYGISAPIGSKAIMRSIVEYEMSARASLLADSRISRVESLNFALEGNVLSVNTNIQIVDTNQSISVGFDARQ